MDKFSSDSKNLEVVNGPHRDFFADEIEPATSFTKDYKPIVKTQTRLERVAKQSADIFGEPELTELEKMRKQLIESAHKDKQQLSKLRDAVVQEQISDAALNLALGRLTNTKMTDYANRDAAYSALSDAVVAAGQFGADVYESAKFVAHNPEANKPEVLNLLQKRIEQTERSYTESEIAATYNELIRAGLIADPRKAKVDGLTTEEIAARLGKASDDIPDAKQRLIQRSAALAQGVI